MTNEQLNNARKYAAKIHWRIASEALTADYYASHVTLDDRQRIKEREEQLAKEIEQGMHDSNFTVAQRMHYYLTGESVPLLSC